MTKQPYQNRVELAANRYVKTVKSIEDCAIELEVLQGDVKAHINVMLKKAEQSIL